jgi:UPF0271 protein
MKHVDLNGDLGEGAGHDAEIMPLITSANIACGGHAGDRETMSATVALAQRHGVRIGAHPGFEDRTHLGRRELRLDSGEITALVTRQVLALRELAPVAHVKPHGGLYNLAARDRGVAEAIASAVRAIDRRLVLMGLANSELVRAGRAAGLTVEEEFFADRTYRGDGTLTSRALPNALITDEDEMVSRVLRVIETHRVATVDETEILMQVDTICLHGDGPHAVMFARRLRQALRDAGIEPRAG